MTDFSSLVQQQSFLIDADTCIDGFKQAIVQSNEPNLTESWPPPSSVDTFQYVQ